MSENTIVQLIIFGLTVLGILKVRSDAAASIAKLEAEAQAHVVKKQADVSELGEQQMTQALNQLAQIIRLLERNTETITRKDEIILSLQTQLITAQTQAIEIQKLAIEAQLGANKQAEMLTAALTGVGRLPDIADSLKQLIEKLTEPMPVEVVNQEKPVPVEVINADLPAAA